MRRFFVLAVSLGAFVLPAFAQEKAVPSTKAVPEAKTTTTVVEEKRVLGRLRRDSDTPKITDRVGERLGNRNKSGFLANLRNR